MLTYSQSTGDISFGEGLLGHGWAGRGDGKNNPEMQHVRCTGPLPRGFYALGAWEEHHGHLGPIVAALTPDSDNVMFGRDAFYIHGPSSTHYGEESMGCIVLPNILRRAVRATGANRLEVVR